MKIATLFGAATVSTFLGLPEASPDAVPDGSICVLGIPGATPYASAGAYCAGAPAAIRAAIAGYAGNRTHHDFDLGGPILPDPALALFDAGDLAFDPADLAGNRARIEAVIGDFARRGVTPIVLGGDDSIQVPSLAAFASAGAFQILQIDAHIDWRDEVQGERFGLSSTMRRVSEHAAVRRIVQVGARAMGSARSTDLADALAAGVRLFDMRAIRAEGLAPVLEALIPGLPLVVCLDVDGLDPAAMPGVIGPAPGGLDYGSLVDLFHGAADLAPLVGFHVVEFVPENDVGGLGALTAARLAIIGIGLAARAKSAA
jgi:agmatinase